MHVKGIEVLLIKKPVDTTGFFKLLNRLPQYKSVIKSFFGF